MRAPPPWVLPSAALFVLLLIGSYIPSYLAAEKEGNEAWPKLVERAMGRDRERPKVEEGPRRRITMIGIGSSLLTCATRHNYDMDRLARDMGKRPVRFRKICAAGHRWDAMPLLESACAARPDVLVIESNMIFQRSREDFEETDAEIFVDYLRWRIKVAWGIGGPKFKRSWPFQILDGPSDHPTPRPVTPATISRTEQHRARTFHPEDAANFVKVLQAARDAGTTIVFLDLAFPAGPAKWSPEQLRAIADMHAFLARETGALTWRYPAELERADFWDTAHLSPQGREKFSRWFVEQVDALPIP